MSSLTREIEEIRAKRRKLRPPKRDRIIIKAAEDASVLLKHQFAGINPSRNYMSDVGMSERRWTWAMGLLRHCGMAYRYGEPGFGIKPIDSLDELDAGLNVLLQRTDKLLNTGTQELTELRIHMPTRYRREP
jgi:hypothetical protein